jgi:hypothetical protein
MSENLTCYDAYLLTRFYRKVRLDSDTGCLIWTAGRGGSRLWDVGEAVFMEPFVHAAKDTERTSWPMKRSLVQCLMEKS